MFINHSNTKIILVILFLSFIYGCASVKREVRPNNGTYCYMAPDWQEFPEKDSVYEEFCQWSIKITSDSVCDMYHRNDYIASLDSCKALMKKRMCKYLIKPTHKVNKYNYEVQKVGRRDWKNDTCLINISFSTYEIIDTATVYCVVDKNGDTIMPWLSIKGGIIIDTTTINHEDFKRGCFSLKDGTIKIIPQGKCYLNLVISKVSSGLPGYFFMNILRLRKGRTYRIWLSDRGDDVRFNDYIRRVNDTTIVHKAKWMKPNEMDTMYLTQ